MTGGALRRAITVARTLQGRLTGTPPSLDLHSAAFRDNPYPFYRALRERDPVHFHALGAWFVTRYGDALALSVDPRFAHPAYGIDSGPNRQANAFESYQSHSLITLNPPDHTRMRKALNDVFTKRFIDSWRPRVQQITDELLEVAGRNRNMDIVSELALPLPLKVILEMLGLPSHDGPLLKEWSTALVRASSIVASPELQGQGIEAARHFHDYFRAQIAERRRAPGDDAISALVRGQAHESHLTDEEIIANATLLFLAGHETTMSLIGSGTLLLLRNPDQFARLRGDPSLVARAIEEFLRYEPPLQFYGRMAMEDVTLDGKRIRRGQTLYILIGAVNRDPEQFPEPERLNIERSHNAHRAFGHGIHACLGQYLARVEGAIAIAALLKRFPGLRLDSEAPQWSSTTGFRSLTSLNVRLN